MLGSSSLTPSPFGVGGPRRRSVDVGGLALALSDETRGHGWGGWEEGESGETRYAENLIDVRAHTEMAVNIEGISTTIPPLTSEDRERLITSLSSWTFEPHKLPPEQVLACAYILFEAIYRIEGMRRDTGIDLERMPLFLNALQQTYRRVNNYHNFEHALDVFQAIYCVLRWENLVPELSILLGDGTWRRPPRTSDSLTNCLNNADIFALCIAAVGHDIGHPGLTNAFLKNAKTPLAVVYDDKSVLEQMHCSLLLQVMHQTGLGGILDRCCTSTLNGAVDLQDCSDLPITTSESVSGHDPPKTCSVSGNTFKKLLVSTVLSTDMGVHDEFMANFDSLIKRRSETLTGNDDDFQTRILVSQALIKCTDISNPARPYSVSSHWASALSEEWSTQLLLEKHLHLPASVYPSSNELSKASGQVFFIERFAGPLFISVERGIPQVGTFASQCQENLRRWKDLKEKLSNEPPAAAPPIPQTDVENVSSPRPTSPAFPSEFLSVFPPTLPKSLLESDVLDDRLEASSTGLSRRASSSSLNSGSDFVSASGDSLPEDWEAEQGSQYESCESDYPSSIPPSPMIDVSFPPKLEISISRPSHLRTRSHSSQHSNRSHRNHHRTPSAFSSHINSRPSSNPQSEVPRSPDAHPHFARPPSTFSMQSSRTSFTNMSNTTNASILATHDTVAIRKAYKASVRKTKSMKNFHRSSWNPSPAEFKAMIDPTSLIFNLSTTPGSAKSPSSHVVRETSPDGLTPRPSMKSNNDTVIPLTPELMTSVATTPDWNPLTPAKLSATASNTLLATSGLRAVTAGHEC